METGKGHSRSDGARSRRGVRSRYVLRRRPRRARAACNCDVEVRLSSHPAAARRVAGRAGGRPRLSSRCARDRKDAVIGASAGAPSSLHLRYAIPTGFQRSYCSFLRRSRRAPETLARSRLRQPLSFYSPLRSGPISYSGLRVMWRRTRSFVDSRDSARRSEECQRG